MIMLFYAFRQYQRLLSYEEPYIMYSVLDSHYSTDHEFTTDDGLMLAFGLTAYDDNQEVIEDPTYGTLRAYYKSWGIKKENTGIDFELIETDACTRAQLGLPKLADDTESDYSQPSLFYEHHPNGLSDVEYYYKKLKCPSQGQLRIQGDYNAVRTRTLYL